MVEKASPWTLQLEKKRYFPLSIPCILQHRWFLCSLNLQRLAFQLGQIVCRGEPISLGKVLPSPCAGRWRYRVPQARVPARLPSSRCCSSADVCWVLAESKAGWGHGQKGFYSFHCHNAEKKRERETLCTSEKKNQLHFEESCETREKKTPKINPPTISEAVPCCSLMTLSPPMAEKMYSCLSPQGCLQHSKWTCSV